MVRANMQSAGVYSPRVVDEYYFQVARHLANAIRVFKNRRHPKTLQQLARDQVGLDASLDVLRFMKSQGRGALLAPAHAVNFLLTAARVNQEIPIRVFLRWSADQRRLRLKQHWCEACGLAVLLEPGGTVSATSRAEMCVDAIKGGEILLITPDVAQRRDEGVGVDLLGRTAYLPTGAAAIAMLAEAPMVPLFSRLEGTRQIMYATEPITVPMLSRNEGGRPAALKGAMQQWANGFEAYLRASPAAWFLWGDSRWTRVFRGDPEYSSFNVEHNR
jgi:lauroyl/myristoyl acyltransferase